MRARAPYGTEEAGNPATAKRVRRWLWNHGRGCDTGKRMSWALERRKEVEKGRMQSVGRIVKRW